MSILHVLKSIVAAHDRALECARSWSEFAGHFDPEAHEQLPGFEVVDRIGMYSELYTTRVSDPWADFDGRVFTWADDDPISYYGQAFLDSRMAREMAPDITWIADRAEEALWSSVADDTQEYCPTGDGDYTGLYETIHSAVRRWVVANYTGDHRETTAPIEVTS